MMFRDVSTNACRTYLIGKPGSGEAILVDPCLDRTETYLELFDREKLRLTHVIDTHTHADHISGGPALRDETGCAYLMHVDAPAPCVTGRIADGAVLNLAGVSFRVMHTPGHTADSVSLLFPDRILTGDVLFLEEGGAGRDDLPGGDSGQHWDSLQSILTLPDHLLVYPGHDYRDRKPTTLRRQKERNPHLRPASRDDFISYVQELKLGPADWMKEVLKANHQCTRDPKAVAIPAGFPACEVMGTLPVGVRDQAVDSLSTAQVEALLKSPGGAPLLLDVREKEELEGGLGHLPEIRHIPIGELHSRCGELERDREIITICRMGGRATTAAQILLEKGFPRVKVMAGGMEAWREGNPSA